MSTPSPPARPTYGPLFWVGLVVGWGVIGYGVYGVLNDVWLRDVPFELAVWVFGSLVLHDALFAPMVLGTVALLAWLLPRPVRGPVAGALALTGLVVLFAYPLLRAFGRRAVNPSILPDDYGQNVLVVLAVIWSITAVVIVARILRARSS
jgi:hypothetical protein